MPSPFPGMNPYLEQNDSWEDFHQSFITHARDVLSDQMGGNYLVKIEVRLYPRELSAEERPLFTGRAVGVPAALPPERFPYSERHSSLEIVDRRNRRVVTVLELLSPANKTPGPDRDDYLRKRTRVLDGRIHLVEIDLRRGGERPRPPELPPCAYYALVSRVQDWPILGMWPISLRDRLPIVPIPLVPPDPDVSLDLQELLHRVYDAAGYAKYIYSETPSPPLSDEDAAWARQFVPQAP